MSKSVKFVKLISPVAFAIALSACGGGSSGADFGSGSGTNAGTTAAATDTGTSADAGTDVGVAEELVFTLQPLEVGLPSLSAGGSTGITTRLIDQNGDLAATDFTISLSSPCISNGTSEIVSPITSNNGVFTTTYTARGCAGDDEITATVGALSQSTTVNVMAAELGNVQFVSAEPQNLLLQGMSAPGLSHTSTVTFQILNNVGGPIANEDVTFELTSDVGGIELASTVGVTDNDGFVSTILQSGAVHTSVRVRAIVDRAGEVISSESSNIVISTGIADQNSFSLSLETLNPAAWDRDGVEVAVNVIASDRFNNPVPDGTAVSLSTELGSITPSCVTVGGRCSGTWTSSDPRDLGINDIRYPHEGITTITAEIIGEESFIDTNSNGIFDDGDILDLNSDKGETFEDYNMGYNTDSLGNPMVTGYSAGLEPFIDFNGNGIRDPKDGLYTGLGCAHETLCALGDDGNPIANGVKGIFTSAELVLSEDTLIVAIIDNATGQALDRSTDSLVNNRSYSVHVFGSRNNQQPPEGTTISISSDEVDFFTGESSTVLSTNEHFSSMFDATRPVVQGPYGPHVFGLSLKDADPDEETDGVIEISLPNTGPIIYRYDDTTPNP